MNLTREFGKGAGREYLYRDIVLDSDLSVFLNREARPLLVEKLEEENLKFFIYVQVRFSKFEENGNIRITEPWFSNEVPAVLYSERKKEDLLDEVFQKIEARFDSYVKNGSGFFFDKVLSLSLMVTRFQPLSGGAPVVPSLPSSILRSKAISLLGNAEGCFLKCVQFHLRKRKPPAALLTYNLDYPTSLTKIPKFESQNGLSIYVFGIVDDKRQVCVYYVSKNRSAKTVIDLLLYKNHYYHIDNLSRLVTNRQHGVNNTHVCRSCLCFYKSSARLRIHRRFCDGKGQVYQLPHGDLAKVSFKNYQAMIMADHVVYYDFETYIKNGRHHPIAVGAKRICVNPRHNSTLFTYFGEDCTLRFLDWLELQKQLIEEIGLHYYRPLLMTPTDWEHFNQQKKCEMCQSEFDDLDNPREKVKCRDHSHLTGSYRYSLCNTCNLTYAAREIKLICIAHNAMKYDMHFLVTEIAKLCKEKEKDKPKFSTISKSSEQNLVIWYKQYVFIDSYQFLMSSLNNLVSTMSDLPLVKEFVGKQHYKLFTKKGIFCYEFLDSPERLEHPHLPAKSLFYNSLDKRDITEEQYQHAKLVWQKMDCKCLRDYTRIYLQTDVLLLADCFEAFRRTTKKNFDLDPAKFLTTPHLGFDCMLKHTGVTLDLMTDQDMLQFIKAGIRGGVSSIMKRHAEADESSQIMYLDCCNLYGYAMSRSLPVGDFKWMTDPELKEFDPLKIDNGHRGFIVECDLDYPEILHDEHNDLPLAPEKVAVQPGAWSQYTKSVAIESGMKLKTGGEKLIPHLGPRRHYVVHSENLKFYLEHGLVLKKVHRGITFKQAKWMKPFIDFTTEQRKNAQSDFESNFWKMMANSSYGKLLQDPAKYNNLKMVTDEIIFRKLVSRPTFKRAVIYNKNLVGVENKRETVYLNKPFIVGFSVLELSKLHMYKFHYLYIKKLYKDKCALCFTDTDSLLYHVKDADFCADMSVNRRYFDLSNYPPDSPLYDATNKKRRVAFKNEHPKNPVIGFVGVRSKMYTTLHESQNTVPRAKGLPNVVVRDMKYEHYLQALHALENPERHHFAAIRSKLHKLYTTSETKKGLSPFDDKRYVLPDGVNTLAHGHFRIKSMR